MERAITGFHLDEEGDWVAELSCGHNQHVRHRPPFQVRAWVLEDDTRTGRIGTPLVCPPCARCESPDILRFVRSSPDWTEETIPRALLRAHRVGPGTWGLLRVQGGSLRFVLLTEPTFEVVVGPGSEQAIPPDVPHYVTPLGPVRFAIDFLAIVRPGVTGDPQSGEIEKGQPPHHRLSDEGGDPACWAGLVCSSCGVVLDGSSHRPDCAGGSDE